MRRHVWLGGVTLVAAMALSNCTDKVGIQVSERFTADLKGTNERPTQVTTTATGSATFTYVADIPALFYRIDVAGIDSAFAAHIHAPADTGSPAGVVVTLFGGSATPLGFSGVLAQGVAEPVKVTDAPGVCGDGEPGVMSAEVHAPAGSVYVPSQYAS